MLVKFEENPMVQTTRNFELFDKKKKKQQQQTNKQTKMGFLQAFLTELTLFWKTFLLLKLYCLLLNYQFKDYHLSLFQKLRRSDTCNQVKSCTKHGRPDQF